MNNKISEISTYSILFEQTKYITYYEHTNTIGQIRVEKKIYQKIHGNSCCYNGAKSLVPRKFLTCWK